MTLATPSPVFPDLVWGAAILRGLDARARAEIEVAGRLRRIGKGELVHRSGEPADVLCVVVQGTCELHAVRRGDDAKSVLRTVSRGEVFGEEAILGALATRHADARARDVCLVAEIPITVLRRAIGRSGGAELVERSERALRRSAAFDLLRASSFARSLAEPDLEVLVDAATHQQLGRGEYVYREGDHPEHAFVVADGVLQAESDDEGRPRVEAYLGRGDLFGEAELEARDPRRISVVAQGPSWVIRLPRDVFLGLVRRDPRLTEGARLRIAPKVTPAAQTTAHVFRDLYRMRVARSLLVIDQNACVRCGHCAFSCASTHEDGISRLLRRGDKIVAQVRQEGTVATPAPLLIPNSCQHCRHPSCMLDCPTGAIGRDARGEVFIREDLCTGCGNCAKGCPWDNIQIAPRGSSAKSEYPEVAVKCDLCSGGEPACVATCPTQAIARIDPNEALVELGPTSPVEASPQAAMPRRASASPWLLGGALASIGVAASKMGPWTSGWLAGALIVGLCAYGALKRLPKLVVRARGALGGHSAAHVLYVGHFLLGGLALGATIAHTHARVTANVAGALLVALGVAFASGIFGALAHALLPRRLSRLERRSVLPEELGSESARLEERLFTLLSGKSEATKVLYAKVLRPYRRSWVGVLRLLVSGRTLREEEAALRARVDALVGGRKSESLKGIDEILRAVVELRALLGTRVLTALLRGWIGVHLAATGIAVVFLVTHALGVLLR